MKHRRTIATVAFAAALVSAVMAGSVLAATALTTVKAGTTGQWVKYDFSTCKYVSAPGHGSTYTAVLRKEAKPVKISWGAQDSVTPFTLALTASINKEAAAAGITVKFWDNKGIDPTLDSTQPVVNAQDIVAYHPAVNMWMNTQGSLTAKTMGLFNAARPCIPTIQFYISPGPNAIYFGNSQPQQGIVSAQYAAPIIKKRGWNLSQTWIVSTGSVSEFGNGPGSAQERITAFTTELRKLLPGIPASHVTLLDCNTTPICRSDMSDWITAHPQAKYVTGDTVYDIRSLGAYAALKAANFGKNALIIGNGDEPAAKALVKAGDPINAAEIDANEQIGGEYVIPLVEDILAGKPVPSSTFIPVTVDCANRCGK